MTEASFLSRRETFTSVGSTNDVVGGWLATGTPEVCVAVAAEQTAGRGRAGRTWTAPPGAGLLVSLGFRPTWLEPARTWQLAAIVALAMADAAEAATGLASRRIRLKWPNDLVLESAGGDVLKLAGLLGETVGLGTTDPRAIVGIGVNADWPAVDFPPELAGRMTSLREVGDQPIDAERLVDAFLDRVEVRVAALRAGRFDVAGWVARQLTNGRAVRLEGHDGATTIVQALGVDPETGGLIVADGSVADGRRIVLTGEIVHLRLDQPVGV